MGTQRTGGGDVVTKSGSFRKDPLLCMKMFLGESPAVSTKGRHSTKCVPT